MQQIHYTRVFFGKKNLDHRGFQDFRNVAQKYKL